MGQRVHFVPPQYEMSPTSRANMPYVERPATVIESVGMAVCLQSINRTGVFFGQDIEHDPHGGEWTWHHADECPRGL